MDSECRIDFDAMKKEEEIHRAEKTTIKSHQVMPWVSDQELLDELKDEQLNNITAAQEEDWSESFKKVQKVPEIMLQSEDLKKYYKPRALSIGPIHAADSNLLSKSKKLKVKLAARFIKDNEKPREDLLNSVKNNIQNLKRFFDEGVIESYDDDSLARLLFLDGCVVLQFIYSNMNPLNLWTNNDDGQAALIEQDLFLLENQIPFQVLTLLMGKKQKQYLKAIYIFVLKNNITETDLWQLFVFARKIERFEKFLVRKEWVHLLNLLRLAVIFDGSNESNSQPSSSTQQTNNSSFSWNCLQCIPWFNRRSDANFYQEIYKMIKATRDQTKYKGKFPNVQELKSAEIDLRLSDSSNIRDISFTTRWYNLRGELKIPSIIVDDWTTRKLLNLVAYETYLNSYDDHLVTSYVNFLDLLIDTEQDVKELREANILRHRLSSDSEVASLFNSLGVIFLHVPKNDAYKSVETKVQVRRRNKFAIWMAQIIQHYLSSPSTALAFLLALIASFLTLNQFWNTIFPKVGLLIDNGIAEFYKSA